MFKQFDIDALSDNWKASYLAVGSSVVICSTASLFALYFWLSANVTANLRLNLPGEDGKPLDMGPSGPLAVLTGVFEKFDGVASDLPGRWPGFRGPNFDNIVGDLPPLASTWPAEGPEVLWSVDIGDGYRHACRLGWRRLYDRLRY